MQPQPSPPARRPLRIGTVYDDQLPAGSPVSHRINHFLRRWLTDTQADLHSTNIASVSVTDVPLGGVGAPEPQRQPSTYTDRGRLRHLRRLGRRVSSFLSAPSAWVLLIALGVAAALIASAVDAPVDRLSTIRRGVATLPAPLGLLLFVLWSVGFACVAAAAVHIEPLAEGSGIPQLRSIMAGSAIPRFLHARVGVFKLLGLIAAQTAGLSIGREGPFVHISSVVAAQAWRLPFFRAAAASDATRRMLLASAIAAGVTGVFGVPLGSVLFAIEVTSSVFPVAWLPRLFIAACTARLAFDAIAAAVDDDVLFSATGFPDTPFSPQLFAFAGLGVLCGFAASGFVFALNKIRIVRRLLLTTTAVRSGSATEGGQSGGAMQQPPAPTTVIPWQRRYGLVATAAGVIALLMFSCPGGRASDRDVIADLFSFVDADDSGGSGSGSTEPTGVGLSDARSSALALSTYLVVRTVATLISISLPVSCGLFIPLFVCGAALGRLYGEAVRWVAGGAASSVVPGVYAVVGASALVSGGTRTISTLVIVFELTGQLTHLLPVLLGTLIAYGVAGSITIGVYDLLGLSAGLPYLPRALPPESNFLTVGDVMHRRVPALTTASTHREALALLLTARAAAAITSTAAQDVSGVGTNAVSGGGVLSQLSELPVLDGGDGESLVGTVTLAGLQQFFHRQQAAQRRRRVKASVHSGGARGSEAESPSTSPRLLSSPPPSAARLTADANGGTQTVNVVNSSPTPATPAQQSRSGRLTAAGASPFTPFPTAGRSRGNGTSDPSNGASSPPTPSPPTACPPSTSNTVRRWLNAARSPTSSVDKAAAAASANTAEFDAAWLDQTVTFAASGSDGALPWDPAPFFISERLPLGKVHFLFATCLFPQILVVARGGKLAGVVLRDDLASARVMQPRLVEARGGVGGARLAAGALGSRRGGDEEVVLSAASLTDEGSDTGASPAEEDEEQAGLLP